MRAGAGRRFLAWGLAAAFLAGAALAVGRVADSLAGDRVRTFAEGLRPDLEVTFGRVGYEILAGRLTVCDLLLRSRDGAEVRAGQFQLWDFQAGEPAPRRARILVRDLAAEVNEDNFGPLAAGLAEMGYERLSCRAGLDWSFDPASGTVDVPALEVDAPGAGRMALSARIEHVDLSRPDLGGFLGAALSSAELRLEDGSLRERAFTLLARLEGSEPGRYRREAVEDLEAEAARLGAAGNPVAGRAMQGLAEFLRGGGTLTLAARPGASVPLLRLLAGRDGPEIMRALNLEARAGN